MVKMTLRNIKFYPSGIALRTEFPRKIHISEINPSMLALSLQNPKMLHPKLGQFLLF